MKAKKLKLLGEVKKRVASTPRAPEMNRKGRRMAIKITMRTMTDLRNNPETRRLELHRKAVIKRKIKKSHGK